jgi:hypothetical protein
MLVGSGAGEGIAPKWWCCIQLAALSFYKYIPHALHANLCSGLCARGKFFSMASGKYLLLIPFVA